MNKSEFDYLERPKQFSENDFWRQVRRTINGEPVSEEQIAMIENQIIKLLQLSKNDNLLDIGCGNGALTTRLKKYVHASKGIDQSDYLIDIATKYFKNENEVYEKASLKDFISVENAFGFNKCLLYGVSSFLNDETLQNLIYWFFNQKGTNNCLFIGNIRDKSLSKHFYSDVVSEDELDDTGSSMGKWRSKAWFEEISHNASLKLTITKMPASFYAHKYYFDVVLESL